MTLLSQSSIESTDHNFGKVPVFGFARSFVTGLPIQNATIKILEDESFQTQTDKKGKFGPIWWTAGKTITLKLEKPASWSRGYRTTQTATITVPVEGINHSNYLNNISFQVPSKIAFKIFSWIMAIKENPKAGQIAVTVTPPGKTLDDLPQGKSGVEVLLEPDLQIKPYYLGIIPFIHKTNFFIRHNHTTADGGVVFPNVPPGTYRLKAIIGEQISEITVIASEGVLTNASPCWGLII